MTYLSGSRSRRSRNAWYVVGGLALLLFVYFWPQVKSGLYPILQPVVKSYAYVKHSFGIFPEFFHTYTTTHKQFATRQIELEQEIERLENEVVKKEAEVRELQHAVGASTSTRSTPPIVLYPLMEDSLNIYSTILLSKGFKDGIEVGNIVYMRGREAVCTIKEVYTSSSLCLLYTSSDVTTEGVTASSSITLTLTGRGGYYLANIVRDTPVAIGEKVFMRDNPSMTLGVVTDILNNNQDTSWHVFVRSVYNPVTTSILYVQ